MVSGAQIYIIEPGQSARMVAVQGTMTIGRDNENDIVLASLSVSRHHAALVCEARRVLLVDLASTNGTLVNGVPALADEPVFLRDGDEIRFGEVLARYVAPPSAEVPPALAHTTRQRQPRVVRTQLDFDRMTLLL